jgi:hypothetical protein
MTDQELNEAVLRSLGWGKEKDGHEVRWHRTEPNGMLSILERLPDYTTDLRAIYDAEWELSQEEHERFTEELRIVVGRDYGVPLPEFAVVSACARQRAGAFLLAKGIWKEKP